MEKMLSEAKAVVRINIIDLQNWEICYLWEVAITGEPEE